MARALQAYLSLTTTRALDGVQMIIGKRHQPLLQHCQEPLNLIRLAAYTQPKRIFKDDGQQLCRRQAAIDRPLEPGGQQPWHSTHMVDMHMNEYQRLEPGDIEIDCQLPGTRAAGAGIPTLKQAAINQH